ncbi:MAG: TonB-dependent receptor, partial [Desulfuromonadales bacterium]|nr:TonB-dependent receptor [Desulfuromonadales bacterium]NIS39527.1 TonB-dependent receptor [Desulfuromonadales bacterium]
FSGSTPNILSELTWDDLRSFQLAAETEMVRSLRPRVSTVLMGRTSYGWIVSGENQDSDYAGDNRTLEWSRSNNDAGNGHVFDLEGGVGVR